MKRFVSLFLLFSVLHSHAQVDSSFPVTDAPLLATAYFLSNSPVCLGSAVCFTDLSYCATPPFGYITTWQWDLGDGNTVTVNFPYDPNICHTYALAGLYTVTLTVTDSYGNTDDYSSNVITNPNPVANFMFIPACDGQPVQFMDLSQTNGGGNIVSWEWDFGDPASGTGNASNLQNPTHLFTGPGMYQVTLNVTSNAGCGNESIHPVAVSPQSAGGSVSGSTTITFGQNTGSMEISGQTGTIVTWQRRHNGGSYSDIPGTAGLLTYSEVPIYAGTWDYRAEVQSGSCTVQFSTPATVVVNSPPGGNAKTWTGAVNDDWNEPGNWTPSGVPLSPDNIVIPASGGQMPKVKNNGFACNDLTILHNATVVVNPGISLTINGQLILE